MKRYEFHSALPPEELKRELDRWVRVENIRLDGKAEMKTKWKDMKLRLSRWDEKPEYRSQHLIANPFRGEVCTDGAGGSILRGKIMPHFAAFILIAFFILLAFAAILRDPQPLHLLFAAVPILLIGLVARSFYCEKRFPPGSRAILKFLERNLQELEA